MPKKLTTEQFIEKAKLTHRDKYNYSKVDYKGNNVKVCIICPIHGEFWQIPNGHLCGNGCPKCSNKHKPSTKEFIENIKLIRGDKYDYSKVEYKRNKKKVCIICSEHGEFWQTPSDHLNNHGCPFCANNIKLTTEQFIGKAKLIHGDKYDYSKVEYENASTNICIICPIHGEFWQQPNHHLNGFGCAICSGKFLDLELFVEKSKLIHGDKYDYSKVNYTNNRTKVCIICLKHGEFYQKPNYHLNGCGCPKCNESHLEKETAQLLDEHGIEYDRQKHFKWLGRQSLDFYLPDYQIAIECQGEQHFEPVDFGSKKENFANNNLKCIQKRDEKKIKLCKENNINLFHYTTVNIPEDFNNYKLITNKNELINVIITYNERI